MTEYWLYVWKKHPDGTGRPCEYSNPPLKIKADGAEQAIEEARALTTGSPKWELYQGSHWSTGAPAVASHTEKMDACAAIAKGLV